MRVRSMTVGYLFLALGTAAMAACGDDSTGSGGGSGGEAATSTTTSATTTGSATTSAQVTSAQSTSAQTTSAQTTSAQTTSGQGGDGGDGTGGGSGGSGGEGGGSNLEDLSCDVVIIGGGASGLHTAFRLGEDLGEGVCLFEKETTLGGRIHDISMDDDPDSPVFGTGARRVMPQQNVLLDLATELDLELETPALGADLVNARGIWALSKEDLLPAYPSITPAKSGDTETALYEELLFGVSRDSVGDFDDFKAFVRESVGNEEFQFLHDASRFRADFEYPLDAVGYMDYLTEEWDVFGEPSYPVGGMSAYIKAMEAAATASGVRIFKGEPVVRIDRDGAGYEVLTGAYRASTPKLVIAVPPVAMRFIDGEVADEIESQQEFQDIIGVKVVTVTQWWPSNWWSQIVDPATDTPVWRGWTTEHCMNFIEIPLEDYAADQLVTRSVYDDDANCVEMWQALWEQGGEAAVNEEVQRGLEHLFVANGVTDPQDVTIPQPLKTHVQIWPAAWHWLITGTDFTNTEVFDWSIEPLPGEDVALVGEAYNVNRSGWSDAAYKSSIRLLNEKYDFDL